MSRVSYFCPDVTHSLGLHHFLLLLFSKEINGSCHCPPELLSRFHRNWDVIPVELGKFLASRVLIHFTFALTRVHCP